MTVTFGNLLREQMQAKRMSASDLARAVWGTTKDYRGYTVARGRDRVGHYLAGTAYPEKSNLNKIAKALSFPVKRLEAVMPPPKVREAHDGVELAFYTEEKSSKGFAIFSMKKVKLPRETAMEILDLIRKNIVP